MSKLAKRSFYLFVVTCLVAALAGWVAARARISYLQREAAEKERVDAEADAKRPAKYFADLVREADEVVITYDSAKDKREAWLSDPAWRAQLSNIIGSASYKLTAFTLITTNLDIVLYQKKVKILELMPIGRVLRAHGARAHGDFIVGNPTTDAIVALAEKVMPRQQVTQMQGGSMVVAAKYQLPAFSSVHEEKSFYSNYARQVIGDTLKIPDAINTDVTLDGEIVTVTFPVEKKMFIDSYPKGPAYTARVKFERLTGHVIEVL